MTNAVSQALAARSEQDLNDPRKLVARYEEEFTSLLPSHLKAAAFVRTAAGALRKGKMSNGKDFDLEVAARNNPQAFVNALREAARLGLAPGSAEYYLTPVRNRQNQGRQEILGITGYQGYIELMYRAGAITSVVVETVHAGEAFEFMRGRDEKPLHQIDWRAERGELELVYAYANMVNGGTSYVVVLNSFDIKEIMKKSASASSKFADSSPWTTNPRAMWLKSAVRQLQKWVPTSTEFINTQAQAARDNGPILIPDAPGVGQQPVPAGAQVYVPEPDDIIDADVVDTPEAPAAEQEPPPPAEAPAETDPPMPAAMLRLIQTQFTKAKFTDPVKRHEFSSQVVGAAVERTQDLTVSQGNKVLDALKAYQTAAKEASDAVPSQ